MTTATKNGRQGTKKNPVTPTRDEIMIMVRDLGGEAEVKRYESIESLEKTQGQHDVLHRWKVGNILKVSFKEHDEAAIRLYSVGLQRASQTLRLSVRLAEMYKEPELRKMLQTAADAGHELNWAHFRQLLRDGLTDTQRADLVARITKHRWGYRELEGVITAALGGKKSQGGRKPGKMKYKTYGGALNAMKMRSQAWLALEEDWIDQIKVLASKLSEDEKHTPEFLAITNAAAAQLRHLSNKAQRDAEEAEALVDTVNEAMGNPKLTLVEESELELQEAVQGIARSVANGAPKSNGAHKTHTKGKSRSKSKSGPRVRLAKHPKVTSGKFANVN